MRKYLIALFLCLTAWTGADAVTTIDECVALATENYPLVRKHDLLSATCAVELSDINRGWLPRIGVYGQGTAQNAVPSFPEALSGIMEQMGYGPRGLGKLQYQAGIDISQTIWDGGTSRARHEAERARNEVQQRSLDVELYAVRQRVEDLYFAILLTEEQIAQSLNTIALLESNLGRLRSMLANGTATQSDVDMVEAQALQTSQNITRARSAVSGYRRVLGLFTGKDLDDENLVVPSADIPLATTSARPEIELFRSREASSRATERLGDTSLMPKISLFGKAYYGYPGYDYFKSMMNRDLSLNLMAGVKVSWQIDSFYTRANTRRRTMIADMETDADRETFLFNSRMQTASINETIDGLREVIRNDARISELRANVRKAAESQLANGIIDTTALLSKITDENNALLTARLHEIQLIQEIYRLKYNLNQ